MSVTRVLRNTLGVSALLHAAIVSGCAKPDRVERVDSPITGVFLTVETYDGPVLAPDFTAIYGHLDVNGKTHTKLLVSGEYLEKTKPVWVDSNEVVLCLPAGYTVPELRRNLATLTVGGRSETISWQIRAYCDLNPGDGVDSIDAARRSD